ncbi:prosaposin isoform X2 [Pelobates cultripes]|uniref:Prosaposin n=1 Tax=Pelobates cultripes TaxID=61616 RepID=A0AAD1TDG8_PELCU|nr:prosaposin isoform X2 [Pelobates cultripes]
MKLCVVLLCLLVSVSASPLLGKEQCAGGPVVWCVNVQTASQCGAVKHCQQNVWNKPTLKSVQCDLCKEIVTAVVNFLKENGTQSQIENYLNKVCDLFHVPSFVSECKELVDTYYPVLYQLVESELENPGVACGAIGLCKNLQQHLGSLSPQQLQTNEIPETVDPKLVYPFIANVPLLLYPEKDILQEHKTGDVCQDCLQLVTDLQETLRSNSSFYHSLVDRALKGCDQLGGGLSDMCKTYINQYAEFVMQAVLQMTAKQICSLLAFCGEMNTPPQSLTPAKLVPAVNLQPAIKIEKEPSVQVDPVCEVCTLMVTELESLLERNQSKGTIENALEKVCYILPNKYRQQCRDFLKTYSEAIIELLEQEFDPKLICSFLGVCLEKKTSDVVKLDPEMVTSGEYCQVCKMIVNYVDTILEKNVTEERIKAALQRVCAFLPDALKDQCSSIIAEYEPMFVQLLLQALDPTFVCMKLSLCPGSKMPLLGTDKCMMGPSYWCRDMNTAEVCNAIQHCKLHVWN